MLARVAEPNLDMMDRNLIKIAGPRTRATERHDQGRFPLPHDTRSKPFFRFRAASFPCRPEPTQCGKARRLTFPLSELNVLQE